MYHAVSSSQARTLPLSPRLTPPRVPLQDGTTPPDLLTSHHDHAACRHRESRSQRQGTQTSSGVRWRVSRFTAPDAPTIAYPRRRSRTAPENLLAVPVILLFITGRFGTAIEMLSAAIRHDPYHPFPRRRPRSEPLSLPYLQRGLDILNRGNLP